MYALVNMNIVINCSTIRAKLYSDKIINVDYLSSILKYYINTADTEQELLDLINWSRYKQVVTVFIYCMNHKFVK